MAARGSRALVVDGASHRRAAANLKDDNAPVPVLYVYAGTPMATKTPSIVDPSGPDALFRSLSLK